MNATAPYSYAIADVRGLRIAAIDHPDECYGEWRLSCPHGGNAVLRLTARQIRAFKLPAFYRLIQHWWQRQAEAFQADYGCDCGTYVFDTEVHA